MKRYLQKITLGMLGTSVLAFLYAAFIERVQVHLDRFTVEIDKPGLPPEGLTILHLSDLHCRAGGRIQSRKLARLKHLLASERYDLALITGDFIHNAAGLPAALEFVASLQPRLGAFSCPGNRDYWESGFSALYRDQTLEANQPLWLRVKEALNQLWNFGHRIARNEQASLHITANNVPAMHAALSIRGVHSLVNQAAHVRAEDVDLWIAGVDDLTQGAPDLAAALSDVPDAALLVLLAHNPDIWLEPGAHRADLVLAGHTHGGQICLPLIGALYAAGTHLTRQRPAGWFRRGTSSMFVSRGVGESFPLRFGAPPQVALIRLVSGGDRVIG